MRWRALVVGGRAGFSSVASDPFEPDERARDLAKL